MPRIDLFVAYEEKDKVKALGAKWDVTNELWFIPEGADPAPFEQWINKAAKLEPNIRCSRFYSWSKNDAKGHWVRGKSDDFDTVGEGFFLGNPYKLEPQ